MRAFTLVVTLSSALFGAWGLAYASGPQTEATPAVPVTPSPSLPNMAPTGKLPGSPAASSAKRDTAGRSAAAVAKDASTAAPGGGPESTANGSLSTTAPNDDTAPQSTPHSVPQNGGDADSKQR